MLKRRWVASLMVAWLLASPAGAQSVLLTEAPLEKRCVRNELTLELKGKHTVKQDGKDVDYPVQVQASHVYDERFLVITGPVADKVARFYSKAEVTIRYNNKDIPVSGLLPEHHFLVAQRIKDQVVAFSPKNSLSRDEIDLVDHFDTMAVSGLVPGKEIAVGKSWKLSNHVVQSLCGLTGLKDHNIDGTLVSVKDGIAQITLVGKVDGIDMGAEVVMLINGRLEFDTREQRIVAVEWKQEDTRKHGPINPAMSADVVIKLKRTPIEVPTNLNDFALVPIPTTETPPANLTNVSHHSAEKRFKIQHSRQWQITDHGMEGPFVMRLMERGDFIAQVTINTWKKVDLKNVITKEVFAEEMSKTPGWHVEKEEKIEEIADRPKGHHALYRVTVSGEIDNVKTWQYFYLVVSPQGEQLLVTFSMVPQHVQRLGARDLELVREITFDAN